MTFCVSIRNQMIGTTRHSFLISRALNAIRNRYTWKMQTSDQNTFLETSFKVNPVTIVQSQKNEADLRYMWKYMHFRSHMAYKQKRAVMIADEAFGLRRLGDCRPAQWDVAHYPCRSARQGSSDCFVHIVLGTFQQMLGLCRITRRLSRRSGSR